MKKNPSLVVSSAKKSMKTPGEDSTEVLVGSDTFRSSKAVSNKEASNDNVTSVDVKKSAKKVTPKAEPASSNYVSEHLQKVLSKPDKDQVSPDLLTDANASLSEAKVFGGSLTFCLVALSKMYHNPCRAEVLCAGLPLEDNELTSPVFPRAAERAGLDTQEQPLKLSDIGQELLPAVLLLNAGNACLLLKKEGGKVEICYQEGQTETVSRSELQKHYCGHVILVKPKIGSLKPLFNVVTDAPSSDNASCSSNAVTNADTPSSDKVPCSSNAVTDADTPSSDKVPCSSNAVTDAEASSSDKVSCPSNAVTDAEASSSDKVSCSSSALAEVGALSSDKAQCSPNALAEAGASSLQSKAFGGGLTFCLVVLSKMYHNPRSAEVLCAGLPLEGNRLTSIVFPRAAERAGLETQEESLELANIDQALLPAVLLLKEENGCLLLKKDGDNAEIRYQEGQTETISLSELQKHYSGHVILVKPKVDYTELERKKLLSQWSWLWSVIKPAWPIYLEVVIASVFVNLLMLAPALFIRTVYDRVVPDPKQTINTMWMFAVGVLVALTIQFFLRLLRTVFLDVTAKNIDNRLSAKIFSHMIGLRMDQRFKSLGRMTATMNGFDAFRTLISSATVSILVDVPFSLLFMWVIWWLAGPVVMVPLIMIPLVLLVSFLVQIPLRRGLNDSFDTDVRQQGSLLEALIGLDVLKARNAHSQIQSQWEQSVGHQSKLGVRNRFYTAIATNFAMSSMMVANVFVVIVGVYEIAEGNMSMGSLIACSILTMRALAPISQVASLVMTYFQARVGMARVQEMMNLPVERPDNKVFLHRPSLEGAVAMREVEYTYPDTPVNALSDLNFSIKPGEHVAVIGRIGSGKSTLLKVIIGFFLPAKGNVLIDGTDLNQIDPIDLRKHIGYVPQSVSLFHGSIRDNIAFGALDTEDERILDVAKSVGLDEMVAQNPEGLNMNVGDRGDLLSGGQRQAIGIAQALLHNPQIMLFDEPTASMDDIAEHKFKQMVKNALKNKTLVLVTHKGSMLDFVDRIILLEGGKIVLDGKRDAVISALKSGKVKVQ